MASTQRAARLPHLEQDAAMRVFPPSQTLTVLFDGSCPICRREIAYYRQLAAREPIDWVDVSDPAKAAAVGLSCEVAMARFHVCDSAGQWWAGGAAFARLWRALPRWRWLGHAFAWPPFSWALEAGYRLFLRWRPTVQRRYVAWQTRRAGPSP